MLEKGGNQRNHVRRRDVVQVVGKSRAVGAALVAAVVVLSGCGTGDGEETTTTTSAAEQPGNPWDLPLEQRPALFDPCTEIPIEAIEQGLGGPVEPVSEYENHRPGGLMSCGWRSDDADFSVLSTWKTREEYLADRSLEVSNDREVLHGREGLRLLTTTGDPTEECLHVLFTERGAIWIHIQLIDLYKRFHGQRLSNACEVIDQISKPVMAYIPKGDFR